MTKHNSQFDRIRDCVITCVARNPAPAFPTLSTAVSRPSQVCHTLDTRCLAAFHKIWKTLSVPSASPFGVRLPFRCPPDCSALCPALLFLSADSTCSTVLCCVQRRLESSQLADLGPACGQIQFSSLIVGVSAPQYALILNAHVNHVCFCQEICVD